MAQQPPQVEGGPDTFASDMAAQGGSAPSGLLARLAYLLGSFGLLAATASDALAVAGRHLGFRFIGSIELVQAAVVVLACAAMLTVTIGRGHASVRMVTDRLRPATRLRLGRAVALLNAGVFLMLAAGSIWISFELWHGHEETELLHIPLRWLRALWIVFALFIAFEFVRTAWRKQG